MGVSTAAAADRPGPTLRSVLMQHDTIAYLLVPAIALLALLLIRSMPVWLTLTLSGLAMGMMLYVMASGLTLIFGLMDVLNLAHSSFVTVGAFLTATLMAKAHGLMPGDSLLADVGVLLVVAVLVMTATGLIGLVFERLFIKPAYGSHNKQLLVTMGGLIIMEQLVLVFWGAKEVSLSRPASLQGSLVVGNFVFEKYRLVAVVSGLVVFGVMRLVLRRTKFGLLVRAGVENPEMVRAFGYHARRISVIVFAVGSALAGLGGMLWGLYLELLNSQVGMDVLVLIFSVIIIGGLGSIEGCLIGALLIGLTNVYVSYALPKGALVSSVVVMAIVLLWRNRGLLPVTRSP
ncbi:MAG: branched-chain amino acid ABC transporter permease [Acetobacteraceae bacterium]